METGLDYFGARFYSGAQGRMISPDLVFADQDVAYPQSWNMHYANIDGGKQYGGTDGAHQEAVNRESVLRGQRGYLGRFNLGGVPESMFLKLGPNNSAMYLSGPWRYQGVDQRRK